MSTMNDKKKRYDIEENHFIPAQAIDPLICQNGKLCFVIMYCLFQSVGLL